MATKKTATKKTATKKTATKKTAAKKKVAKKAPVNADVEVAPAYTAWAPTDMPIGGKSNSTEQLNDHPTEHNHAASAVSDIVDRFADLRLYVPGVNSCGIAGDLQVDSNATVNNVLTVGNTLTTAWANVTNNLSVGALLTADVLTVTNTLTTAWANVTNNLTVGAQLNVGTEFYVSGQDVKVGYLRAAIGDYNWPSHSFDADKKTGFYLAAGGYIGTAGNLLIDDILQVEGRIKATNGSSAAPVYSFQADSTTGMYLYSAGIATIACDGKNIANFGKDGVSFPEGLATITGTAANMHIGADGQLRRITDVTKTPTTADLERLETLVEKLSARIEELESALRPAAKPAAS